MAVTIVATVGASDANSYVDVDTASDYFDGRLNAAEWTTAGNTSPETQSTALAMAARRLDQELFVGRKYDDDQALEWPRTGARDPNGRLFGTDEIPPRVKRAQMELALALLRDTDLLEDTGLEAFRNLKVGPLALETKPSSAGSLPANVMREIAPYLIAGGAAVRMERG